MIGTDRQMTLCIVLEWMGCVFVCVCDRNRQMTLHCFGVDGGGEGGVVCVIGTDNTLHCLFFLGGRE